MKASLSLARFYYSCPCAVQEDRSARAHGREPDGGRPWDRSAGAAPDMAQIVVLVLLPHACSGWWCWCYLEHVLDGGAGAALSMQRMSSGAAKQCALSFQQTWSVQVPKRANRGAHKERRALRYAHACTHREES